MNPLNIKNIDSYSPDYTPGHASQDREAARKKKRKTDHHKQPTDHAENDSDSDDAHGGNDYLGTQVDLEA
jgi:hypothetical protein